MAAACGRTMQPDGPLLWQRAPRGAAALIAATILGGLALDATLGQAGQLAANLWAAAVFAWLYRGGGRAERRALVLCLTISFAGEMFLSLVWGLYHYRLGNIPLFVPPGHALLMTLGLLLARRLPSWSLWLVPLAALPWTLAGLAQGWDTLGAALFALFALCTLCCSARPLYVAMFALSLLLELYGTWLGNWTWRSDVPWLALTTTNPPLAAGAFYCVLDLLVLAAAAAGYRTGRRE